MRNRELEKIPFRSKLPKYRNIENRNKVFNALSKKEQRMEIAYDALKLVSIGKVVAAYGEYWGHKLKSIEHRTNSPKEFQECLLDLPEGCAACQRGLMMVSQIRLGNNIDPVADYDIHSGSEKIIKGFSMSKFFEMESAYESGIFGHDIYSKNSKRLANICCNVIANGNFNKFDKTDYLKKWKITIK
jgi:hypothetical protein